MNKLRVALIFMFVGFTAYIYIYFRTVKINITIPKDYIGEVYVIFGEKSSFSLSKDYTYVVNNKGLCLSPERAPLGQIMASSLCYRYEGSNDCLNNIYGERSKHQKHQGKIVVFAPTFVDHHQSSTQKDSLLDFSYGLLRAVVDTLESKRVYNRDIRDLFNGE